MAPSPPGPDGTQPPPGPADEEARLAALHRLGVLDTGRDRELDELVALVARVFDAASASVSLIDTDRQWFEASVGIIETETETAREGGFCDHTIRQRSVLVVEDATQDRRFETNPLVTGQPFIRFYAGAPLVTREGAVVGAVFVFDARRRMASPYQLAVLETAAQQVVDRLELGPVRRLAAVDAVDAETGVDGEPGTVPPGLEPGGRRDEHLRRLVVHGTTGFVEADVYGVITFVNHTTSRMLGYAPEAAARGPGAAAGGLRRQPDGGRAARRGRGVRPREPGDVPVPGCHR